MRLPVNMHFLLLSELLAEFSRGRDEAYIFQPWRVQLVRQGSDLVRCLDGVLPQFVHATMEFSRLLGKIVLELVNP